MVKVYENIKKFIKENYKFLIVYIVVLIICLWPLPYYIYTGGGTINLDNRISIENEHIEKGSFNLAYVKNVKATIPTYLLSYILNWDVEKIETYQINNQESSEDIWKREKLYLQESIDNAIINAYKLAGEDLNIKNEVYKVLSIDEDANTNLRIDDAILEINGIKVTNYDSLKSIVSDCSFGEKINVLVLRGDKEVMCYANVFEHEQEKKMGVYLIKSFDYDYTRKIELGFSKREGGSSGGFMLSLAIYNRLIEKDLTNGLKIVGTGTIDNEGNVGNIDGVKYKLKGAVKEKADIFFVPSGRNYEEAIKEKEENNYKIKVIEVKTLLDAINYLESRL